MNDINTYIESKRGEMVEELSRLIKIDSAATPAEPGYPFGRGSAEALGAAMELMERLGFRCRNYGNYAVTGEIGEGELALDILAHMDVVPGGDGWSVTAPFEPKVVGDNIYGRGTSDDKGPAIAAMYAMKAVLDSGVPLKKRIRMILGGNEENGGGDDLEYFYAREKGAEYSVSPDADYPLINCERGINDIVFSGDIGGNIAYLEAGFRPNAVPGTATVEYKPFEAPLPEGGGAKRRGESSDSGSLSRCATAPSEREPSRRSLEEVFNEKLAPLGLSLEELEAENPGFRRIRVIGEGCHSSLPELGKNALTALLWLLRELDADKKLSALSRLFPYGDGHGTAAGIDMQDGESGRITVSLNMLKVENGRATGVVDCRVPLCATEENCSGLLSKRLLEAGFGTDDMRLTGVHYVPKDSPLVKTLLDSYEKITGRRGEPIAIGGGTYVHDIENGVAFGCQELGVDYRMHGADEYFSTDELVRSAKIYADVIMSFER